MTGTDHRPAVLTWLATAIHAILERPTIAFITLFKSAISSDQSIIHGIQLQGRDDLSNCLRSYSGQITHGRCQRQMRWGD